MRYQLLKISFILYLINPKTYFILYKSSKNKVFRYVIFMFINFGRLKLLLVMIHL